MSKIVFIIQVAPYAGEVFDLGIKAIDELGNPTTASFRLTDGGTVNSPNSKVFALYLCTIFCVITHNNVRVSTLSKVKISVALTVI